MQYIDNQDIYWCQSETFEAYWSQYTSDWTVVSFLCVMANKISRTPSKAEQKILKRSIEDHQPYFLYAETKPGECDREIDEMLEVCKIQEKLGGRFVWNFNQPVGHTREPGRQINPLTGPSWDETCGYLTNSPNIYKIMNPKSSGFEFEEQQMVYDAAWDEVMSNLMKKGDARDSNGKFFRVYPKTKRHMLKNNGERLKTPIKLKLGYKVI